MAIDAARAKSLFLAAADIADLANRAAYLEGECGGDAELRTRVEALLRANDALPLPPLPEAQAAPAQGEPDFTQLFHDPNMRVGQILAGRYKLIEEIGQGGMGAVFMAQQVEPVKRIVAVKIIKSGMDSREVLARFETERQALALMDHPNIARVLDAGTTESGRPYFVMELVKGTPITQYCDQHRLTPRQRLDLFLPVCKAIQHAHQKGVIHRDIKPSNVLVAPYDDRPVPKVIDFGLAKAAGQALTEKTLITGFGALVGTPEYMSPEQASLNNLDVDTRSDVYSLGVLLYELLTGSTPVDRKSLGNAALLEVLRIIREVEAPRPSTKLSGSDGLPNIAANRSTEPAKLATLMRGELDWVLMKALEKDRTRRYETANGLARDIERYLSDEVVEARPPSTTYRLWKFVRRHKPQATAVGLVLLALLAGITGTTIGLSRAEQQKDRAEAGEKLAGDRLVQVEDEKKKVEVEKKKVDEERQIAEAVRDFLRYKLLSQADTRTQANALLQAGQSSTAAKFNPTIGELLDRAATELSREKIEASFPKQPTVQAELLSTVGETYRAIGEYEKAIYFLSRAAELYKSHLPADHLDSLDNLNHLARSYCDTGRFPKAIALFEELVDVESKRLGADHPTTLFTHRHLGIAYQGAGRLPQAIEVFQQVHETAVKKFGSEDTITLLALGNLASAYAAVGKLPQAIELGQQVHDAFMKKLGSDHPYTLGVLKGLALVYRDAGRLQEATDLFQQVSDAQVKKLGADHPETLDTLRNLAVVRKDTGRLPQAIELLKRVSEAQAKKLGANHPETLSTLSDLAGAYLSSGKVSQGIEMTKQVYDAAVTKLGADHPSTLGTLYNLAVAYMTSGNTEQALAFFEKAAIGIERRDYVDAQAPAILSQTAKAYEAAKQFKKAEAWRRKLLALMKQKEGDESIAYIYQLFLLSANLLFQERFADAEPMLREGAEKLEKQLSNKQLNRAQIDATKKMLGSVTLYRANLLAGIGRNLLHMKRYAEAEPTLRECLKQCEKLLATKQATPLDIANSKSLLGDALLGQKKLAEAEPLLRCGYEGIRQNENQLPEPLRRVCVREAIQRLIDLAAAMNKPDEVNKWQAEMAKYPLPKPVEKE